MKCFARMIEVFVFITFSARTDLNFNYLLLDEAAHFVPFFHRRRTQPAQKTPHETGSNVNYELTALCFRTDQESAF